MNRIKVTRAKHGKFTKARNWKVVDTRIVPREFIYEGYDQAIRGALHLANTGYVNPWGLKGFNLL